MLSFFKSMFQLFRMSFVRVWSCHIFEEITLFSWRHLLFGTTTGKVLDGFGRIIAWNGW